jgi:hypothetical protein
MCSTVGVSDGWHMAPGTAITELTCLVVVVVLVLAGRSTVEGRYGVLRLVEATTPITRASLHLFGVPVLGSSTEIKKWLRSSTEIKKWLRSSTEIKKWPQVRSTPATRRRCLHCTAPSVGQLALRRKWARNYAFTSN